ncbi:MAG: gliding motility protein GldN [Alphaproteobacteria bacterium]|nr:gliding motility protein GldN [Alphaproteobacteria bacterium]
MNTILKFLTVMIFMSFAFISNAQLNFKKTTAKPKTTTTNPAPTLPKATDAVPNKTNAKDSAAANSNTTVVPTPISDTSKSTSTETTTTTNQDNTSTQPPVNENVPTNSTNSSNNGSDTISEDDIVDKQPQKSLRSNYGFINNNEETDYSPDDVFPIEEQKLRHEDAVFSEILWEEIDCREKINLPFIYKGKDENGKDQRLFVLLVKAIVDGNITAFEDDKFTTPKPISRLRTELKGTKELQLVDNAFDPSKKDSVYIFNTKLAVKTDSVYIFRIKVHYIFDKKTSVFYKRILGVAPIARFGQYGDIKAPSNAGPNERTVFWLYYPDIKTYLSKQYVYNPFNLTKKMTWEELFNSRIFSSYFIKTTYQNINDEKISQFIKDPYWRLLRSDQIKNRVYDWESDRWEY